MPPDPAFPLTEIQSKRCVKDKAPSGTLTTGFDRNAMLKVVSNHCNKKLSQKSPCISTLGDTSQGLMASSGQPITFVSSTYHDNKDGCPAANSGKVFDSKGNLIYSSNFKNECNFALTQAIDQCRLRTITVKIVLC